MKLTESINRRLLNESESLYNRILDVVADREIHDENLVLAVGDDAIRIRNEQTNKEVWIKPDDTDDGIESKILSTFDKEGLGEQDGSTRVDGSKFKEELLNLPGNTWATDLDHNRIMFRCDRLEDAKRIVEILKQFNMKDIKLKEPDTPSSRTDVTFDGLSDSINMINPDDGEDMTCFDIIDWVNSTNESEGLEEASKGEKNTSPDWLVNILNELHNSYEFIDFSATHLKYKENETHLVRIFTNDEDKIPDNVTELKMLIAKGLPEGFDIKSEGGYKAYGSGGFVYTFEVYKTNVEESEELEEASLWDSLPDEFKGKIAGANEIVSKLQSVQGVNATAEVSGNNLTIVLSGDMLKAMDAVDILSQAANQQGLNVLTNYGEKKFTVTITQ